MGFTEFTEPQEIPKGWNTGVLTNNFCVIDLDRPDLVPRFRAKYKEFITTEIATPSGTHFYGSNLVRNEQNDGWDVRGWHGYVLGVGSRTRKGIYRCLTEIVPVRELKEFPPELFEKKPTKNVSTTVIRDVRKWLNAIYVDGDSRGHNATYKAACKLIDAGLSESEALAELLEWNENHCSPKFTLRELVHKTTDAARR